MADIIEKTFKNIGIAAADLCQQNKVAQLAQQLAIPIANLDDDQFDFLLIQTKLYLALKCCQAKQDKPFYVDFIDGEQAYRHRRSTVRNEAIAKAVGVNAKHKPRVLDATAGFGYDGAILAHLGCEVMLLESNPIIASLLQDGVNRAHNANHLNNMVFLHCMDSCAYMADPDGVPPDVVYLDPMYPEKSSSAKVKKRSYILQQIAGYQPHEAQLLRYAAALASKKVVVKRPIWADPIPGMPITNQIMSKKHRFDVYTC